MITKRIFIALLIAAMSTITALAQNGQSPTGSWQGVVTNLQGGPPPFRVLMNFTADGGFVGTGDGDNFAGGSPQHGVWEEVRGGGRGSGRKFALTFHQLFYNPDSSSAGMVKVRQTVTMNASGDSWQGPFKVDIFAPDGTLVFSGAGTSTATRIQSEPLP